MPCPLLGGGSSTPPRYGSLQVAGGGSTSQRLAKLGGVSAQRVPSAERRHEKKEAFGDLGVREGVCVLALRQDPSPFQRPETRWRSRRQGLDTRGVMVGHERGPLGGPAQPRHLPTRTAPPVSRPRVTARRGGLLCSESPPGRGTRGGGSAGARAEDFVEPGRYTNTGTQTTGTPPTGIPKTCSGCGRSLRRNHLHCLPTPRSIRPKTLNGPTYPPRRQPQPWLVEIEPMGSHDRTASANWRLRGFARQMSSLNSPPSKGTSHCGGSVPATNSTSLLPYHTPSASAGGAARPCCGGTCRVGGRAPRGRVRTRREPAQAPGASVSSSF